MRRVRMKRTVQTTLTGKVLSRKPVHDLSKPENDTLYCQFVEAYCRFNDRPRQRAVSVGEAQSEWRKIRDDEAVVRRKLD